MDNGASSYRRYLAGDDNGLVETIQAYQAGLTLYLCGIVGDLHTAEDLVEETFVCLAVRRPRFRGKCRFQTWLYTIGRNLALDVLRKRGRAGIVSSEEIGELADPDLLATVYLRDERRRALHRAMVRLPMEYRQVLWLIYFEEMDNAQTAAVMGKSKRQVENLHYRAKQSLKSMLAEEGITGEEL